MLPCLSSLRRATAGAGVALLLGATPALAAPGVPSEVPQACLTSGEARRVSGRLLIETPITRAVWPDSDGERGAIEIEYLGPTTQQTPAASGRVLQQVGLRLRAQDPCNAIYIMWPVGPQAKLRVLVKVNEGQSTFAQCGARGYRWLVPESATAVAPLQTGEPRQFDAAIADDRLTVTIDNRVAWIGRVGAAAAKLSGYTGLRTDNVRVRLRWIGPLPSRPPDRAGTAARPPLSCRRRA